LNTLRATFLEQEKGVNESNADLTALLQLKHWVVFDISFNKLIHKNQSIDKTKNHRLKAYEKANIYKFYFLTTSLFLFK